MFETMQLIVRQLVYSINHLDFLAVIVFLIFSIVGALLHELGHVFVAQLYGIKKAKIFFKRLSNSTMCLPLFFVDIDHKLLMAFPRHKRKMIYLGGVIIDVLVGSIALIYAANFFLENSIVIGIFLACASRLLFSSWLNLIPVSSIKSDGWRLLNPDAP